MITVDYSVELSVVLLLCFSCTQSRFWRTVPYYPTMRRCSYCASGAAQMCVYVCTVYRQGIGTVLLVLRYRYATADALTVVVLYLRYSLTFIFHPFSSLFSAVFFFSETPDYF